MLVLKDPDEVEVEDELGLNVLEEGGEDVLLLGGGQVGVEGDVVVEEVKVGGMGVGNLLVAQGLFEEGVSEVGLDEGQQLLLRQLPFSLAVNSCHAI